MANAWTKDLTIANVIKDLVTQRENAYKAYLDVYLSEGDSNRALILKGKWLGMSDVIENFIKIYS